MKAPRIVLAALATVLVAVAGCSSSKGGGGSSGSGGSQVTGTIQVFAAASLKETFTQLGKQFEAAHPGVKVEFNFAASSALATQITQGAKADVFASAAPGNMDTVDKAGDLDGAAKTFAKNQGEIAVPPSNPGKITSVKDLANSGVTVAVCQPQVPCGKVATAIFKNAGITVTPKTEEADVKSTLAKVTSNEVDAGIVYVTDVKAAGDSVKGIEIPADVNATTDYPIAVVKGTGHKSTAQAWVDYVLSSTGQQALSSAGFLSP